MDALNKALMIANDFPPIGGAGVQRAFYFAKYLPEFGWQPVVITVKDVVFPAKDDTMIADLPDCVRVVRTESLELRRILWLLSRLRRRDHDGDEDARDAPVRADDMGARSRDFGRSFRNWLLVPDDRVLWIPFVIAKALRIMRREEISVIWTTSPPYTSAVIGTMLARLTKRPLVVDLRDAWSQDPYVHHPTKLHHRLNVRLERRAVEAASRVIVISPTMREHLLRAHPEIPEQKVEVITNGFDPREFARIGSAARARPFVLTYVGSLYAHHREVLAALCDAWSALAAADSHFADNSRLLLVGRCDPEIREEIGARPDIDFQLLGYQPHEEAIRRLKGASALLLLIRDLDPERHTITIPGKLFEYVGAGRPILMIGPTGDAADIVEAQGGSVHRQDDEAGIRESLARLSRLKTSATPDVSGSVTYDRRFLTKRLAGTIGKVARTP